MTMPLPPAYNRMRFDAMHWVGIGTTREMKTIELGVFIPFWFSKQLTLSEKINLWRGKMYCASKLRNERFSTDLRKKVTILKILPTALFLKNRK
jgi:hypothetical protein